MAMNHPSLAFSIQIAFRKLIQLETVIAFYSFKMIELFNCINFVLFYLIIVYITFISWLNVNILLRTKLLRYRTSWRWVQRVFFLLVVYWWLLLWFFACLFLCFASYFALRTWGFRHFDIDLLRRFCRNFSLSAMMNFVLILT